MAAERVWFHNLSDNVVEVKNLRDTLAGTLLTTVLKPSLTVTGRMLDAADVAVSNVADPFSFTEVSGKKGLFRATIPDIAGPLVVGDTGSFRITADTTVAGELRVFVIEYVVVEED